VPLQRRQRSGLPPAPVPSRLSKGDGDDEGDANFVSLGESDEEANGTSDAAESSLSLSLKRATGE
jgi:hypothetical protein